MEFKIEVYDSNLKVTREIVFNTTEVEQVDEKTFDIYKYYVVKADNNSRRVSISTKNRAQVRGGGRKARKQKGTGFARQGSIRAPQWKGGGVVFGPNNRSYKEKINRKLMKKFMLLLIIKLLTQNNIVLIDEKIEVTKFKRIDDTTNLNKFFYNSFFHNEILIMKSLKNNFWSKDVIDFKDMMVRHLIVESKVRTKIFITLITFKSIVEKYNLGEILC